MAISKTSEIYKEINDQVPSQWAFTFDGTSEDLATAVSKANIPPDIKSFILRLGHKGCSAIHAWCEIPIAEKSESSGPQVPVLVINISITNY